MGREAPETMMLVALAARVKRAAKAGCCVSGQLLGFAGQVQWKDYRVRELRNLREKSSD